VLNCVREHAPVSRTQIRERTRIRLASITELVRELSDEGLVREDGSAGTGRGRKQILLRLNPGYGVAIGVEFDVDHVIAVATDLDMNVMARAAVDVSLTRGKDAVIATLVEQIERIIGEAGVSRDKIIGIGVADPGLVDAARKVSVLSSTIEGWRDVPLGSILEERFGVPVYMEENTRAKTLAEKRFGAGQSVGNLMFIDFGPGIGCGVMTPDGLFRGAGGTAGELGHTYVVENGPVCRCGSYGCLETVASLPAIARRAADAMRQGAESRIGELAGGDIEAISATHVFEAARQGDKLALGIVDDTAAYLGIAVANAVNLFNPEMVVFDARLDAVQDLMLAPIQNRVKRQALEAATRDLRFEIAQLGAESGALGVAAIVTDTVFA
jgi:N-acetylglucosamine repressor